MKSFLLMLNALCLVFASQMSYARHAAILIDANNGNVLHEVDAKHAWYPASLTKLMTLYVTFDALSNQQIHLHDVMRTSEHASDQPNSKLGLHHGEHLTVEDAILAIITRSANDATVVLAEHLAVTEDNFAVRMTAKAHSMGMYNTYFMNATGLPNDWQVTTARDMAVLAWKIQKQFPEYYSYFAAHSFQFKGREWQGINKFTASYEGAEGMKTGFTCASGYNLISAATQQGRHLIGVVLGGHTSVERYNLMINQMNHGFAGDYAVQGNINTMATSNAGIPPHQLECGGGAVHSEEHESTHHKSHRGKGRSLAKSTKLKPRHVRHAHH